MCEACSHSDLWVLNKTNNGQADTHSKVNTMRASSSSCMVNAWCQVVETDREQDLIIRRMLSLGIYHMCPSCHNLMLLLLPVGKLALSCPHIHMQKVCKYACMTGKRENIFHPLQATV